MADLWDFDFNVVFRTICIRHSSFLLLTTDTAGPAWKWSQCFSTICITIVSGLKAHTVSTKEIINMKDPPHYFV